MINCIDIPYTGIINLDSNNFKPWHPNVSCNWISSFKKSSSSRYQTSKFSSRLGTECKVSHFRSNSKFIFWFWFSVVHLVDFGLAKKYTSSATGHEKEGTTKVKGHFPLKQLKTLNMVSMILWKSESAPKNICPQMYSNNGKQDSPNQAEETTVFQSYLSWRIWEMYDSYSMTKPLWECPEISY